MGDALKGRRLLIAAAVAAAVMVGIGAAAQAGLLSRAESGDESSRAAGAAIGDPSAPGSDMVAVSESTATHNEDGASASATLLRVGDTKVGEAPPGVNDVLAPALNGQPTEALIDGGCDGDTEAAQDAPMCAALLQTFVFEDDENGATAVYAPVVVGTEETGLIYVLPSAAGQGGCDGLAIGALVYMSSTGEGLDVSEDFNECAE
jgi:hypothetical protein